MKNISDKFLAVLYQLLLDNYGRLLPNQFYYDDPIPKNSAAFKLYISLIEVYVYTLRKIEKRGRTFGQMLQKRRLRSILRIAYTTKWWQRYFERHDINWKGEDAMKILERIPPVTRFDFIDVPKEEFLTCRPGDKKVVWRRSGGSTTGTPFEWGLNKTLLIINVLSQFIKQFEQEGFSLKDAGRNDFYISKEEGRTREANFGAYPALFASYRNAGELKSMSILLKDDTISYIEYYFGRCIT